MSKEITEIQIRKGYRPVPRVQLSIPDDEVRLTRQDAKDECDVNRILQKYQQTGLIDHRAKHEPRYGFADSVDLHEAMNLITEAQEMFDDLPSATRKRFQNDPGQFLDFVQDPDNANEMVKLGLAQRPEGWTDSEPLSEAKTGADTGNASTASEPAAEAPPPQ